ncbi:hypothetical protein BDN70DRAFT_885306 [Pholiota conissans]|uniref:BTB domain-containing protein n=1 Tax=Pholiota conissans TaxID=109636 RepID=A0A9P5YU98_9AGAR|nr:hypothetical protein BDN70DRAFT_885306 [Pholiota conissans]
MTSLQLNEISDSNQRVSKLFNAPDADVTFISCDDVIFKVDSRYLSSHTSIGFAEGSLGGSACSEPVHLLESAAVLDILFQFIIPPDASRNYRQPSLVGMDPDLFFGVAEAVEKYVIYGAMNISLARMELLVEHYPVEVLCHSIKHGYPDLADRVAQQTMLLPFNDVIAAIKTSGNSDMLLKWLMFHAKWRAVATFMADRVDQFIGKECIILARFSALYSRQVDRNPSSISERPSLTEPLVSKECTAPNKG